MWLSRRLICLGSSIRASIGIQLFVGISKIVYFLITYSSFGMQYGFQENWYNSKCLGNLVNASIGTQLLASPLKKKPYGSFGV